MKNKYIKTIKGVEVDVYDILNGFEVTNSATAHAVKKLLMAGQRGYKDKIQDLKEARSALDRAIELESVVLFYVCNTVNVYESCGLIYKDIYPVLEETKGEYLIRTKGGTYWYRKDIFRKVLNV